MASALHELLEIQEMASFKSLCLTKSKTMKALVSDPRLKEIMQRGCGYINKAIAGICLDFI